MEGRRRGTSGRRSHSLVRPPFPWLSQTSNLAWTSSQSSQSLGSSQLVLFTIQCSVWTGGRHVPLPLSWAAWYRYHVSPVISCMLTAFSTFFFISALLKIFKQAQNLLSCAVQGSCDEDIIQWMIVSQLHHDPCSCGLNLAAPVILGLTHNPWPMDEITKIISLITWFCFASLSQWPLRYPFYSKHNSLHPYWRPWTFFLLSAAFPKLSWLKGLTGVSLYICYKLYKLYCRELERRWPCIWGEHNSPAFLTGGNL